MKDVYVKAVWTSLFFVLFFSCDGLQCEAQLAVWLSYSVLVVINETLIKVSMNL